MSTRLPSTELPGRDHGGGLDNARARYGGAREDWIDLSTGINPEPYPLPPLSEAGWTALPDVAAMSKLSGAAREFWQAPEGAEVLASPGASALIARIPMLVQPGTVAIHAPTYNEHAAAFRATGWALNSMPLGVGAHFDAAVFVHPNNPDGKLWADGNMTSADLTIIDESFCDVCPDKSLIHRAGDPGVVVLKSFGKFWGLAGLRLGFAFGASDTIAALSDMLGPWPVSGPALEIGTCALRDMDWARRTRERLVQDTARLDDLIINGAGGRLVGGTSLFRLYDVDGPEEWQDRLARHRIWSRIFPYSATWLRLGLPPVDGWERLEKAL